MNSWDIRTLNLRPHAPEILSDTRDARAIAIEIPAGEELQDHQVHERAWVTVIGGEVEFTTANGDKVAGGPGLMVEFEPSERHAVLAHSDARLLLLLMPWPGPGHPGSMTLEEKATVRQRASDRAAQP